MSLINNDTPPVTPPAKVLADNIRTRLTEMANYNLDGYAYIENCLNSTREDVTKEEVIAELGADAVKLAPIAQKLRELLAIADDSLAVKFDALTKTYVPYVAPAPDPAP